MDDLTSQKRHKRINLTDPDARLMKGRQGIVAGYNAQAMVSPTETDGGATGMLVTAVDVVDAANDNALLVPMVDQAEETTGTRAHMTLADAGYFAASHLAECTRRGQRVVVSESRQRFLKDPYHKDQFTYNEPSDSFTCPQGQTLKFVRIQHANGVPRLYRASGAVCQACPAFRTCTRAKEIGRSLAIGPHDAVLRRHRAWMSTPAAREAYKLESNWSSLSSESSRSNRGHAAARSRQRGGRVDYVGHSLQPAHSLSGVELQPLHRSIQWPGASSRLLTCSDDTRTHRSVACTTRSGQGLSRTLRLPLSAISTSETGSTVNFRGTWDQSGGRPSNPCTGSGRQTRRRWASGSSP